MSSSRVATDKSTATQFIRTVDDFLAALTGEAFADYTVKSHGPNFVEIEHVDGFVVLAWPELWQDKGELEPHMRRARAGYMPLVILGTDEQFAAHAASELRENGEISAQPLPMGIPRLQILLRNRRESAAHRREAADGALLQDRYRGELDELVAIGRALSTERDIDKLLALILERLRAVTRADAGSVYVVQEPPEEEDTKERSLLFKISQNDTVKLDFTEFTLPVSKQSIVGCCVLEREVINIPDLYNLDAPGTGNNPWGFKHNSAFDDKIGYQTRSMLTVPMIDANEQVIGVIQLINRRERTDTRLVQAVDFDTKVVEFDESSQELAATLASQAGISLENARLYQEIRELFEGFVRASVTAIESRDPTTSGHSQRVADLTVCLAKVTDQHDRGPYADLHIDYQEIQQIEYAALLHDFGKVGVREHVLVKAEKLYPHEKELLFSRFDYIRQAMQTEVLESKVKYLLEMSRDKALAEIDQMNAHLEERIKEFDDFIAFVLKANQPTVLEQGGFERLTELAERTFVDYRGEKTPILSPCEVTALQISRGSLTKDERVEIESHVSHTYAFLRRIPWGRTFRSIPQIAGAHHEKLDGSGYPRQLKADEIPVGAKMMTISDIYDALTASDRPYKRAVPVQKALDILGYEVKAGKCDADLYKLFLDAKVYETAHQK